MPILIKPESVLDVGSDRVVDETSDEHFDRTAFARRAIDIVQPRRTTIAICEGASRMRVESGRNWRRPRTDSHPPGYVGANEAGEADEADERWALLAIPARASRRAIALAVAELARAPRAYALDVLMGEVDGLSEAAPVRPPTEPSAG
jgi:hypothetical protein